jgi:hypothetical protein
MRLVLLLAASLALAGCTTPATDDENTVPAAFAEDPAPEPAAEPQPEPASEPDPRSQPEPQPEPPAPEPQPEPPAPEPAPWTLTGEARLGWVAGVGAGGAGAPAQGQTDATHCPGASFVVPTGASQLRLAIASPPADPSGPGAGQYAITLTGPDGSVATLEPVMDDVPESEGGNREHVADAPPGGEWRLHAEPMGPVAGQVWTVALEVTGEAVEVPAALVVTASCS